MRFDRVCHNIILTWFFLASLLETQATSNPESIPKPNPDPTLVPLPGSELSGTSLGDSVCSMSPSLKSQSSSGEEDAYESDYISGDDLMEDQHDVNDGNIFEMEADEKVSEKCSH